MSWFWLTNCNMYETNSIASFIGEKNNWKGQILNRSSSLEVSWVDWVYGKDCSGWYQLSSLLCFMTPEWHVTCGTDVIVWVCLSTGSWLAAQWGHVPVSHPLGDLHTVWCRGWCRNCDLFLCDDCWSLWILDGVQLRCLMRGVIFVHTLPLFCL